MTSLLHFFLLWSIFQICLLAVRAQEGDDSDSGEPLNTGRHPTLFKAGDEWLSLPEVFSNLDFAADSTPASDDDIEGQEKLRATRFWGRIYIEGWPQTIQFFRAHFGVEPPQGKKRFVFAEPRDACGELTNGHLLTNDHVVLVNRGTCTFGAKSKNIQAAGASAIVIINNEPGLDHLPGPDAHDIVFSVNSIAQTEGQLLETVYDEGPQEGGFGRKLEGYIIPINCARQGGSCGPATVEERENIKNLLDGGTVSVSRPDGSAVVGPDELPMEYLLAHFGTRVLDESLSLPIVRAQPPEACDTITNDVKGKVVLVRRGGCPFVQKSEAVQSAGGRTMVVGGLQPFLVRMGVEPRWKGLNTAIPVVMVSQRSYGVLLAESITGTSTISFSENAAVNGSAWEQIEKLANGDGWPRSATYIGKKKEELLAQHADWPDRLMSVEKGFAAVSSQIKDKDEL